MVKTRHSDELSPHAGPEFMSLDNERHSRRAINDSGDGSCASRAYTEGSNAFNIFEEKVVDTRLRPRTGPSRTYNYLDEDSSDEDTGCHTRRLGGRNLSANRLHHRQIKMEMLEEENQKSRRSRLSLRRRTLSLGEEESDGSGQDNVTLDENQRKSSSRIFGRSKMEQDSGMVERRSRAVRRCVSLGKTEGMNEAESDKERKKLRQVRSTRHRQQQSSDEDEEQANNLQTRTSLRQKRDEEDCEEDDETENVRRSSRKRRQVFDSLNQSYQVSRPGKNKQDPDIHNEDTKDEDSDNDQDFTDMYSRVKRKRVHIKRNMYGVPIEDSDSEDAQDENTNNNNDDDDDDDDDDDEEEEDEDERNDNNADQSRRVLRTRRNLRRPQAQEKTVKSYSLRQHKPTIDRYNPVVEKRRVRRVENSVFASTPTKNNSKQPYQSPARRRDIRKRSALNSSSSSTSSSDSESSDEKNFKRRKAKSMAKARNRMMPMNMTSDALASASVLKDRVKSGVSLADVEPMNIDKSVNFNSIGGLGKHIRKLKEMVVFPLLYDNVFQRFKVDPPRGVLFYGPPGTGKTLVARALANECSQGDRRVAFFMRKGADCLSKWVGESERQLRLLFDQAYKFRPSIIFFDEIDGLAPVRSSRQDQIHSSIVSTLLALMDGLDNRGEIVVIGATNRIDSLDPALRRPGRFDREFLFPLPSLESRKQILKIHTNSWNPRLNDHFLSELAEKCVGYCGADLKALCTEAAMQALRRRYPQIYLTNEALKLDVSSINVSAKDFFNAIASIIPTSQRSVNTPARALAPRVAPLLQPQLDYVMDKLADIFPASLTEKPSEGCAANFVQAKKLEESGIPWDELLSDEDEDAPSIFVPATPTKGSKAFKGTSLDTQPSTSQAVSAYLNFTSYATSKPTTFRPRLMLVGCEGQGQTTHMAPAVVHQMENLPVHVLDLPTLYAVTAKTPEESCANVFHEAKRKCPSILYLPYMDQWWDVMADTLRATLLTLIHDLDPALPLLLLATSERPYHQLDPTLRSLFSTHSCEVSVMRNPDKEERLAFFKDLLLRQAFKPPPQKKQAEELLKLINVAKHPSNKSKRRGKFRRFKLKQLSTVPNFIYPFGRHEGNVQGYSFRAHEKEDDQSYSEHSKTPCALKSQEAMTRLANLRLKLHKEPIMHSKLNMLKPCHKMVLRSRVQATGGLNSNQSARVSAPPQMSLLCKSSNRVLSSNQPTRIMLRRSTFGKRRINEMISSDVQEEIQTEGCVNSALLSRTRKISSVKSLSKDGDKGQDHFIKPFKAPLRMAKCHGVRSISKQITEGVDDGGLLSTELTSRHERYVRRLLRLEAKMSEIATNSASSVSFCTPESQASYCALSARHLRYLRRLRKIDKALHQAKSHCLVQHSSSIRVRHQFSGISRKSNSTFSCGSFQMLHRKKESYLLQNNLSLPLNINDLSGQRKSGRRQRGIVSQRNLSTDGKDMAGNLCHQPPYNLRKKRLHQRAQRMLESLPLAEAPKPRELSQAELALLVEKEELTLMELRIFLRDVLNKLGTDKKFSIFAKPVNIEDAADYYDIIETPMDLSSMMAKIDLHEYSTVRDFLNDIDLICSNALEYNPDRGPMDRVIRHRACALKDTAYAIIKTELDKDFEKTCVEIQESRKRRGEKSGTVPNFYNTRLKHGNSSRSQAAASAIPSYLDKPHLPRTIPKPEGERFSRRVRGLNSDPVPPLEAVEKVFKTLRPESSPVREDKNNSSNAQNEDGDLKLSAARAKQTGEDEEDCDHDISNNAEERKQSEAVDDPPCKETNEEKCGDAADKSTANPSTSKKKRPSCVWCRPKRKRQRFSLPRSGAKSGSAEKKADGDHEEEMSVEEDDKEENDSQQNHDSKVDVKRQLIVETTETEVKDIIVKSPELRDRLSGTSTLAVPNGVSTRRSSMSPRLASASTSQPALTSKTADGQKSGVSASFKECGKDTTPKEEEKSQTEKSSTNPTTTSPHLPLDSAPAVERLTVTEKRRVVKRLDLDMVITDSGHGSSLESNGDSRDSTDHKGEVQTSDTISKALPTIEALANSNHNCNPELHTTATAILEAPRQSVVVDLPRMTRLLEKLVARTDGYTVERLEKIYSQLSQLIYRHRHNYDRTPMIVAMEKKVDDLTKTIPGATH